MRFHQSKTQLVVIDVQSKLFHHIDDDVTLEGNIKKLIQGINLLEIPVTVSEQYKKGLGETIPSLLDDLASAVFFEKTSFSVYDDETISHKLSKNKKSQIILCGIEAHICVLQSALDLIERGFDVAVVVDAIGSRNQTDKKIALERLKQEGVKLVTFESILFELCRDAKNPVFKEISSIIK